MANGPTRNGKPDYKRLNEALARLPNEAFKVSVRIQENQELLREFLPQLDALIDGADRNLWNGVECGAVMNPNYTTLHTPPHSTTLHPTSLNTKNDRFP